MVIKKHLWFLLPLLILGLFAMKTLWGPEYFDGHDSQAHLVRLYQYDLALKDGQFPPKWAGGLFSGRGYPVFIFAYPLPYAIAETLHLSGFTLPVAIKLTFVLAYLTSTMAMYFFGLEYWKSKRAGFLSALLWSWTPYMFVKIFITASLGVVVSYAFIPLVFLCLYKLFKNPNPKSSILLSLTSAGWVMSHLGTLTIFSPLLVIFTLFYLNKKNARHLALSALLTLLLSGWYLFPALLEMEYTHFKDFVTYQYEGQFVTLKRLLYSKWGTGAPGWSDNPLSQQVGIAQWLAIITVILAVIKKKSSKALPFLLSFVLSIFLMLQVSEFVWKLKTPLQSVSTPWRFLGLAIFSAAVSAGYIVKVVKSSIFRRLLILLLISLALYGNRNHLRINEKVVYSQEFFENYTGVATGWNEHLPIWVKKMPKDFPQEKVEVINGQCAIINLINKSNLQSFTVDCQEASIIQLNTAYYPGWQITTNNQDITNQIKNSLDSSNGMIQFSLNPGQHSVIAQFQDTPLRQASLIISLVTFVLVIYNIL